MRLKVIEVVLKLACLNDSYICVHLFIQFAFDLMELGKLNDQQPLVEFILASEVTDPFFFDLRKYQ